MIHDTKERYGLISRLFHWAVALLVVWQALKIFDRIDDGKHWVGQNLVPWHISIGFLVLVLLVPRIIWTLRNHGNRPPAPEPKSSVAGSLKASLMAWDSIFNIICIMRSLVCRFNLRVGRESLRPGDCLRGNALSPANNRPFADSQPPLFRTSPKKMPRRRGNHRQFASALLRPVSRRCCMGGVARR